MSKMGLGDAELFSADVKMTQIERFVFFFAGDLGDAIYTGFIGPCSMSSVGLNTLDICMAIARAGGILLKIKLTAGIVLFHFFGLFLHHWHCNAVARTYENTV